MPDSQNDRPETAGAEVPTNHDLRRKDGVIDQRQQRIDPTGRHGADPSDATEAGPHPTQKQPGQSLRNPQDRFRGDDDAE
ncbi:MAG: hypothetical protein B7Z31_07715 [Rhodobacterales bacterium 12-65-15]|nr:MAG: hypothetical protein B7Z31_07715 [Rhodobacterales bacterium 12-65-15]